MPECSAESQQIGLALSLQFEKPPAPSQFRPGCEINNFADGIIAFAHGRVQKQ
jgi:hypothetical protein